MSSFTSPLWVTPLSDGKNWELLRPFTYHVGNKYSKTVINIPRGFITDFASIPRLFFFLPDWATYNKSSPIHDYLYKFKTLNGEPITRKWVDSIFLEAMGVDFRHHRSGKIVALMEYWAVRLFGWLVWKMKKEKADA